MQVAVDRASTDDPPLTAMARLRDKPGAYDLGVTCSADGPLGASCSADCEGALFSIHPGGRGLTLHHRDTIDFINFSDGGGRVRLQRDGMDYRLDPLDCLAAYDRPTDAYRAGTATPVPSVAGE